jgi:cytochrome b involved in lipid metabolism
MIRIWHQSASDAVGKKPSFDSDESTIHAFLIKSAVVGVGLCSAFCYLLERSSLLHSIIILLMSILALDLVRQTLSNWSSSTLTSSASSLQEGHAQRPSSNVVIPKLNSVQPDPLLWMIHGVSYDLQEFVDRHPGGRESILLGRGRDCTALFESYHAFSHQHRYVIHLCVIERTSEKGKKRRSLSYEYVVNLFMLSFVGMFWRNIEDRKHRCPRKNRASRISFIKYCKSERLLP